MLCTKEQTSLNFACVPHLILELPLLKLLASYGITNRKETKTFNLSYCEFICLLHVLLCQKQTRAGCPLLVLIDTRDDTHQSQLIRINTRCD